MSEPRWTRPLILAVASPRRRDLLEQVGIPIEVVPAHVDEALAPGTGGEDAVLQLARDKAAEVARHHPDRVVLGADTLVRVNGDLLGKPADPDHARRMLARLSGRWHEVLTGVVLLSSGREPGERIGYTRVRLASLTAAEIDRYVAGTDPYDKAGAYGIQSRGGWFIREIEGSFSNVTGLPLEQVRDLLAAAGLPLPDLDGATGGH